MNTFKTMSTAIGCTLILSSAAFAAFSSFDDLATGTIYNPGDTFTSDGINVKVQDFQWADGTWTSGGHARVSTDWWAHGSYNELNTNNTNALSTILRIKPNALLTHPATANNIVFFSICLR